MAESFQFTGIADEAGTDLETQIRATRELGWSHLELRNVAVDGQPAANVHDIPDAAFDRLCDRLGEAGLRVSAFGSTIGNWASRITDPFEQTLERVERAIPRMQRLGVRYVRVMSYAVSRDGDGRDLADQNAPERFRRLREIVKRFQDAGLTVAHENCMNYGGMSIRHALETLENVPGLKWLFDTGNPVFNEDRENPGSMQNTWRFYQAVKPHIAYIHIKDGVYNPSKKDCDYTLPGEGSGCVREVLADALAGGYDGFVSIEPHTAVVFHSGAAPAGDPEELARQQYDSYLAYGRAIGRLVDEIRRPAPTP